MFPIICINIGTGASVLKVSKDSVSLRVGGTVVGKINFLYISK